MIQGWAKRWREPARELTEWQAEAVRAVAEGLRVSPLVAHLLVQRGSGDAEAARRFVEPKLTDLHDPRLLPGCDRAAGRIVDALRGGEPIVIYGDYDVDGVTATAILYHTLRLADPDAPADRVRRYIPHRLDEGYGLNAESIHKLADAGAKLIVSVDCGITAVEPARAARERGVDLVVTDHHQMGPALPDAYALVHPRLDPDRPAARDGVAGDAAAEPYPFEELCGAGVAYKLAWQVARQWAGSERVPEAFRHLLVDLLALAALGTVADVVPLVGENRTIAAFGLGRIKQTRFEGLNALIDHAQLRGEKIDAYHVGFVLGPRLNACGRMGHAKDACKLLTTARGEEAGRIAAMLHRANEDRRAAERAIVKEARERIVDRGYDRDEVRAIVLEGEGWHPGVVGIVCSRLVEAFGRPTILLNADNGVATGSGRSIDGFDLHGALAACAEHLTKWGGHAMAAGLSLPRDKVEAFRSSMVEYAATKLAPADLTPTLELDAEVALGQLDGPTVKQVERLAPFGRSNREPTLLVRRLVVDQSPQTVGARGDHLVVHLRQGSRVVRGIAWKRGEWVERLSRGQTVDAAIQPKVKSWRGRERVEAVIEDLAGV